MNYDVRPVTENEFPAFARVIGLAFGGKPPEEEIADYLKTTELDRTLAVFDEGEIVGTAGIDSFTLTVPGPRTIPAAGVTAVSVMATHRRRGLLRTMMARQLDDVHERKEPVAILLASESIIYGRFGYGLATTQATYEIDPRHSAFVVEPNTGGKLAFLDKSSAATILPDVYDRVRRMQPGAVTRTAMWWDRYFSDPERWREGASERYSAAYKSENGTYDGYLCYRIKEDWNNGFPNNTLNLVQLLAVTEEARAALWGYCFNVDLITTVRASNFSLDEPIRWMLRDPRRLRIANSNDFLWVRVVDVAAALEGRRYSTADRVVFEVEDTFRPQTAGRYALDGGPDGAVCVRTAEAPHIALRIADLGATYLGGTRFSTLARAGRVNELSPGALRRADLMFSCDPQAWCCTPF